MTDSIRAALVGIVVLLCQGCVSTPTAESRRLRESLAAAIADAHGQLAAISDRLLETRQVLKTLTESDAEKSKSASALLMPAIKRAEVARDALEERVSALEDLRDDTPNRIERLLERRVAAFNAQLPLAVAATNELTRAVNALKIYRRRDPREWLAEIDADLESWQEAHRELRSGLKEVENDFRIWQGGGPHRAHGKIDQVIRMLDGARSALQRIASFTASLSELRDQAKRDLKDQTDLKISDPLWSEFLRMKVRHQEMVTNVQAAITDCSNRLDQISEVLTAPEPVGAGGS